MQTYVHLVYAHIIYVAYMSMYEIYKYLALCLPLNSLILE